MNKLLIILFNVTVQLQQTPFQSLLFDIGSPSHFQGHLWLKIGQIYSSTSALSSVRLGHRLGIGALRHNILSPTNELEWEALWSHFPQIKLLDPLGAFYSMMRQQGKDFENGVTKKNRTETICREPKSKEKNQKKQKMKRRRKNIEKDQQIQIILLIQIILRLFYDY